MSLPDTVFIFVLALIIFGPKKLPEIGRQLGRLVGEFRRASNEFKFQIEEELRQVELSDRQTTSARKNELESTSSNPSAEPSATDATTEPDDSTTSPDFIYPEEKLPVGQYPNVETLDPDTLNIPNLNPAESESSRDEKDAELSADTRSDSPTIRAADGAQPRTSSPYAGAETAPSAAAETVPSAIGGETESAPDATAAAAPPPLTPMSEHERVDPYAAPPVAADITHG